MEGCSKSIFPPFRVGARFGSLPGLVFEAFWVRKWNQNRSQDGSRNDLKNETPKGLPQEAKIGPKTPSQGRVQVSRRAFGPQLGSKMTQNRPQEEDFPGMRRMMCQGRLPDPPGTPPRGPQGPQKGPPDPPRLNFGADLGVNMANFGLMFGSSSNKNRQNRQSRQN